MVWGAGASRCSLTLIYSEFQTLPEIEGTGKKGKANKTEEKEMERKTKGKGKMTCRSNSARSETPKFS